MNLNRILRTIRRSWKQALAVGLVLGALAMLAGSLLSKPSHTATNTVLFQVAEMDKVSDPSVATTYATTLAASYTSMLNEPIVTQPLAKKVDVEQEALEAGLKVMAPKNNLVATITYESEDQAQATQVVTLAGQQLDQLVDQTTDSVGGQPRIQVVRQSTNVFETPGTAPNLVGTLLKGIVAGLMGFLGWLLVRALLDHKVHERADLEEVSDSSVLAHLHEPQDAAALARAVPFLGLGSPASLLVTSSVAKEAPAPVAVSAARTLAAEPGARVLLVDADLREGRASRQLGLDGPGLSEYLAGTHDLAGLVREVDGLQVLGSGTLPPNPAELLASPRLAQLLEQAGGDHLVVLCSPGLLEHSDAALVASRAAGTVLLVGARRVGQAQVRESLDLLDAVGARFKGQLLSDPKAVRA